MSSLAVVTPFQIRAYAQSCGSGHDWLKITSTEKPDVVCPYCATLDVESRLSWTLQSPREEPDGG